jgi:hypothetical protein
LLTTPPRVKAAQTAVKRTKKDTPSTSRVLGETGVSGFKGGL